MQRLITILLAMLSGVAIAQTPEFYADIVRGEVLIRKGNQGQSSLKPKMFIYKDDAISVKEGAVVTLVSKDNRYLEIRTKGNYSCDSLVKLSPKRSTTVTEQYFSLVWSELKNSAGSAAVNVRNVARSFGGVSRSACDLKMFPMGGSITSSQSVQFEWNRPEGVGEFTFALMNKDKTPLVTTIVTDTQHIVDLKNYLQAAPIEFYWSVQGANSSCGIQTMNKLIWLPEEKYQQMVSQIAASVENDGTHHYYLSIGQKLLDRGFYLTAAEYLLKAMPSVN